MTSAWRQGPSRSSVCHLACTAHVLWPKHVLTQCAHAALYGEEVVGAIGTRLERLTTPAAPQQASRLYIMTLGVLAPFRSHGIGTHPDAAATIKHVCCSCSRGAGAGSRLLQIILQLASMDPAVTEAYLHVHVVNNDAFDFYARWGFQHGGIVENYYRRIEPRHAVILRKPLTGAYTASLASFSA